MSEAAPKPMQRNNKKNAFLFCIFSLKECPKYLQGSKE